MSGRSRTVFACSACSAQTPRWLGKCPECGAWNTLVEESVGGGDAPRREGIARAAKGASAREPARPLPDVGGEDVRRVPTGVAEFDRCLGGGVVPGSLVLLGGEPGIGKSTLLLQVGESLASSGARVLYVSGEESPAQLKLRADRIGAAASALHVLGETDMDAILSEVERLKPAMLVIDSVQVVHDQALDSAPGTVSQVKQAADRLLRLAKQTGVAVVLIGHVTKDGMLAGPRTLEHLVDTVLAFESEAGHVHRLVRTVKNRFGPAGEVGVFEMRGSGLVEVPDVSRLFLAERRRGSPGSVVFPSVEGTRPVLVEIQALVSGTAYAQPKRMAVGIDGNRLALLLAVLERKADQRVVDKDVFLNVAGGLKLRETAADLPVTLAIVSSLLGRALPHDMAAFGEIGLAGEIRSVDRAPLRLKEAKALGFDRCLVARGNASDAERPDGLQVVPVADVAGALAHLFPELAFDATPEPPRPRDERGLPGTRIR